MPSTTAPATTPRLSAVAAATPDSRDRYLDLLRAVAISVVALGHWLLAVVTVGPDGAVTGSNALVEVPALQRLTWLFQVMPLFFLVGGVVNARSLRSWRRSGRGDAVWVRARLERLTGPAIVFVLVWSVAAAAAGYAGIAAGSVQLAAHLVAVPLWFLAVYVPVVALAPFTLALHDRHGAGVVAVLIALSAGTDLLHGAGVPLIGWSSFLWVWLLPQQLGYLWGDGHRLTRPERGVALALAGLGALVLLTTAVGYPVSLVGVDGAARSNNAPPSLALVALTFAQTGAAVALRARVSPLLQHPRVWLAVIAVNARAMTLYLWHLTALVVVAATLVPWGFLSGQVPGTGAWWATRPLWLAVLAVVLVPIVALAGRAERLAAADSAPTRPWPLALAVVACSLAAALLATQGFRVPTSPAGLPATALAAGTVGVLALRRSRRSA
jgi:hypothetical protein